MMESSGLTSSGSFRRMKKRLPNLQKRLGGSWRGPFSNTQRQAELEAEAERAAERAAEQERADADMDAATLLRREARRKNPNQYLPLKIVLRDLTLYRAFKDFTKSQHASENLLFYMAVETFRKHKYIQANDELQLILAEAMAAPVRRQFNVENTKLHINMARSFKLPMSQVGAILDALKIYETFLQDGARMWVCVSPPVLKDLSAVLLKEPQHMKQSVFELAAEQAFLTLDKDVLPRFLDSDVSQRVEERMAYYHRMLARRKRGNTMDRRKSKKPMSKVAVLKRKSLAVIRSLSKAPSTVKHGHSHHHLDSDSDSEDLSLSRVRLVSEQRSDEGGDADSDEEASRDGGRHRDGGFRRRNHRHAMDVEDDKW